MHQLEDIVTWVIAEFSPITGGRDAPTVLRT